MASLRSGLQSELTDRISAMIRNGEHRGQTLREAQLARLFGVSRSPVRAALGHLVEAGVLGVEPAGGYTVLRVPAADGSHVGPGGRAGSTYGLILRDIILGETADPISESALMRRYGVGRGDLGAVLRRLVREGLAEPSPGRGWTFLAFSAESLSRSYHLRTILEPALVVDPSFRIDPDVLGRLLAEHRATLASLGPQSGWEVLFDQDAGFHESLAQLTGNDLVTDVVRRQNRLRRLAEYVGYVRLDRVAESLREHIRVLEALLEGDRSWAAALLRQHLIVSREETEAYFEKDLEAVRRRWPTLSSAGRIGGSPEPARNGEEVGE